MLNLLGSIIQGIGKVLKAIGEGIKDAFQGKEKTYRVDATLDSKTCKFCQAMNGRKVRGKDIKSGGFGGKDNLTPPYHPNCRCKLVEVP